MNIDESYPYIINPDSMPYSKFIYTLVVLEKVRKKAIIVKVRMREI